MLPGLAPKSIRHSSAASFACELSHSHRGFNPVKTSQVDFYNRFNGLQWGRWENR
jgi:hypothetical protein